MKRILVALIVVAVVAAGLVGAYYYRQQQTPVPTARGALAACAEVVVRSMHAPASAVFPSVDDPGVIVYPPTTPDSPAWGLVGWVDGQNAFGAVVRTRFNCAAEWKGTHFEATVTAS
jgi:hypothetical protein